MLTLYFPLITPVNVTTFYVFKWPNFERETRLLKFDENKKILLYKTSLQTLNMSPFFVNTDIPSNN